MRTPVPLPPSPARGPHGPPRQTGKVVNNRRHRLRWIARTTFRILIVTSVADVAAVALTLALGETLAEGLGPRPAHDLVAVLYADRHDLGPSTIARLNLAARIGAEQYLLVGGARPDLGFFGSCKMRTELERMGIPRAIIATETRSFDTRSNIEALLRFEDEHKPSTVAVVTDALQALRVRFLVGQDVRVYAVSVMDRPLLQVVGAAQHEVLAWLALLVLPDRVYDSIVRQLRASTVERSGPCLDQG